mmetsp:Transcript_25135/g.41214  ORF Transcript_25135/g.41214 Transcript_25135/m.41214 type:complete len:88 (+) Transcript_25135:333-596(+)
MAIKTALTSTFMCHRYMILEGTFQSKSESFAMFLHKKREVTFAWFHLADQKRLPYRHKAWFDVSLAHSAVQGATFGLLKAELTVKAV